MNDDELKQPESSLYTATNRLEDHAEKVENAFSVNSKKVTSLTI